MKQRLDLALTVRGLVKSRSVAQELINNRKVKVDGKFVTKPAHKVTEENGIEVLEQPKYVSRAGLKLETALAEFKIAVTGLNVLDAGASTGGFTDVLLQNGAKKVWAIDVGHDQLDPKLRNDDRVVVFEGYNIRDLVLDDIGQQVDLIVGDLSFISLILVLEPLTKVLKSGHEMVLLIKPQFEVGKERLAHTGVVTSHEQRQEAISKVLVTAQKLGLEKVSLTESPIKGSSGNVEYLVQLHKNG
ncbi:MAG: TlyA family RNA methyltransferase [Micrococcaceae bacterium]